MRHKPITAIEVHRDRTPGPWFSDENCANNGRFLLPYDGRTLCVLSSDGGGWDHVSVSIVGSLETPTWSDMCYVRRLFFRGDEWVMQFHPPPSLNRNYYPGCLHLWKPQNREIPTPDPDMVAPGVKFSAEVGTNAGTEGSRS